MRDFSTIRRLVIKVGTNVLSGSGGIDTDYLRVMARQIAQVRTSNRQVLLVTSGALGMGATALGIKHRIQDIKKRQAAAAIGQSILMQEYRDAFAEHGLQVAQILLTNNLLSSRKYYVNLKNTVETLLQMGVIPIINENDCVSIEEIDLAFGDNDNLSALIASKIDAELLIILTDVEGLYDRNPARSADAKLVPVVYEITPEIKGMAGKAGSAHSTGGMAGKLKAIAVAADAGCRVVLAHGRVENAVPRILEGESVGTIFMPRRRLSNRKRWILNCRTDARIELDAGAEKALRGSRSLLPVGITGLHGTFKAGDVVYLGQIAKGITDLSSRQLSTLLERRNSDALPRKAVVHADNIVLL